MVKTNFVGADLRSAKLPHIGGGAAYLKYAIMEGTDDDYFSKVHTITEEDFHLSDYVYV
jgi:hypothetical protein